MVYYVDGNRGPCTDSIGTAGVYMYITPTLFGPIGDAMVFLHFAFFFVSIKSQSTNPYEIGLNHETPKVYYGRIATDRAGWDLQQCRDQRGEMGSIWTRT